MISNNEFDDWGQAPASADQNQEGAAGVDLMQVAMRRKGLIALGIFVGLCLGLLYYARATPKYESTALLSIVDKAPPMATAGRLEQAFDLTTPAEDHAIRIKTQLIINKALSMNKETLKGLTSLSPPKVENALQEIYDGLEVQPVQDGSEVLALSYRGTNADDCALILDYVMQAYTDFLNVGRQNVGKDLKNWITEEHDQRETELTLKNQEYQAWRANSNLFRLSDDGTNIHQQRLAAIEQHQLEEQFRIDQIAVQIEVIEDAVKTGADPRAMLMLAKHSFNLQNDSSERILLTEQIRAEIQKQIRSEERSLPYHLQDMQLKQRYGKDHPTRKSIREQIGLAERIYEENAAETTDFSLSDDLERSREELERYLMSLRSDYKAGRKTIEHLQERFTIESKLAKDTAVDAAKNRSYQEEIARMQRMYELVVDKVSEANMLDAYGGENKFIIDQLQTPAPGLRVEPSLAKSLAAGTMLGFMAGFGLGYLVEMFDKTFRDPQEVSRVLQLPMVGHIPEITTEAVEGSALSEVLVAAHKPKSPLAENFRAIRTALYFSTAGQQNHVIQTTSPVPGDGKSTLTANLAVTIAQSNKSVLLLDADFRRPTQHKLFGLTNEVGLSTVVTGEADPVQAAQATEVPNLYVMGCGPRPHNPSELLTSPHFADLLAVLREQYDFVLIDTPPVLAVTDPGIVSARVDGVLMALRIRKNGRPSAVRARKILHDLDANMLGIVVNGIDHRSGSYGYYSSYRKGYGYNYSYQYGQDATEQAIGKYYEEPAAATPESVPQNRT